MTSQTHTGLGRWYEGTDTLAQDVRVRLTRNSIEFMPWPPRPQASTSAPPSEAELAASQPSLPGLRRYARRGLEVGEWWRGSPTPVGLPDGGTLWLPEDSTMGRELGGQALTTQLSAHWAWVVCCVVLLVSLVAWFDRQGAGLLASAALPLVPQRIDQALGQQVEAQLNREFLRPSRLPQWRQERLQDRFDELADRSFPGVTLELRFARLKDRAGFNAMALPNGTIVVLDGMAEALSDDELIAVLGHEAGHVKHRHSMRHLVQAAGLVTVAGAVLGDFSTVAAGTLASVQTLRYSRDAERQSDAEAQRVILREHLPNETLVGAWIKLREQMRATGQADSGPGWLSTHPPIVERIETARRAAQEAEPAR